MKTLSAIVIIAFLISSVVGLQAVKIVNANAIPGEPLAPTEPIKDPPTTIIQSPDTTTYSQNIIPLNITIVQPDSSFQFQANPGILFQLQA